MAKKISSVFYEINVDNPNKLANYDAAKLVKEVGEDLKTYCGKPVQGMVVATSVSDKIMATAKKDMIAGKLKHPLVRAGICGAELIFQVTDKDDAKYEQVGVLNKNYVKLRDDIKKEKPAIGNLEPKDAIAKESADKMGKATGATAKHGEGKMNFGKITGTKSLMLIAHGSVQKTDEGDTLYGKNFGGKSAADLVKLLTENKDEAKRLSPEYAGTIYLNGCYTATPDKMGTYIGTVWQLLKSKGYTKLKVKGNLGSASVNDDGSMTTTTPEAEDAAEKLQKKFEREQGVKLDDYNAAVEKKEKDLKIAEGKVEQAKKGLKAAEGTHQKLMTARANIWKTTFQKANDTAGFQEAPLVQKIDKEITGTLDPSIKKFKTEIDTWEKAATTLKDDLDTWHKALVKLVGEITKIPGFKVKDFVGQFGLTAYR